MIEERVLPWVQDNSNDGYPVWSDFGANQRDVFFLDYEGIIDTSFNSTPYDPSDPDDVLYLRAKNWGSGNVPNWRAMSNNTLYVDDYSHLMEEFWKNGYEINKKTGFANGEPYGFFNLPLSRKYGRLKDGLMKGAEIYPTKVDNVVGTNPCGEISLSDYECCNLCELYFKVLLMFCYPSPM